MGLLNRSHRKETPQNGRIFCSTASFPSVKTSVHQVSSAHVWPTTCKFEPGGHVTPVGLTIAIARSLHVCNGDLLYVVRFLYSLLSTWRGHNQEKLSCFHLFNRRLLTKIYLIILTVNTVTVIGASEGRRKGVIIIPTLPKNARTHSPSSQ